MLIDKNTILVGNHTASRAKEARAAVRSTRPIRAGDAQQNIDEIL